MLIPLDSSAIRLNAHDFTLFRNDFVRELEKILPVSATPVFWSHGQKVSPGLAEGQLAQMLPQLQDICAGGEPGRVQDLPVLPLTVADGEKMAVILQGIDPGLSRKMDQEWLATIRDRFRTSLELIKQAHVHPETGLYTSRLLYSQLAEVPVAPASLFLVGASYRASSSSTGLLQLVQTARLLENLAPGAVYYLGGNLFGVLQDNTGREGALHFGRRLLGRMKREGLRTVHIGIAVRGETGSAEESGSWFAECWQAHEIAERRGPFSLCESTTLRQHRLARPSGEVIRQLRRGWRDCERFGLLLFWGEEGGVPMDLAALLKGCLGSSEVLAPAAPGEDYVLLPGASPQDTLRRGHTLKKKLDRFAGPGRVALGISTWPCLNYARTETAVNCRKALLHGRFLGPGAVTVFDHVSLNVSGDHFFDEGDYRQAVRDYQAGLRMDGGDVNLMNSLGVTLAESNRQQQAVNAFDRVLARDPGNYMALVNKSFPHSGLMTRKPVPHDAPIVTRFMAVSIIITGIFIIIGGILQISTAFLGGTTPAEINTVFFAAFIITAVWNGINFRALDGRMPPFLKGNPTFFVVMVAIVIAQILIIQYGGTVFNTVPLSLEQWAKIIIASASVLVVGFFLRIVFRYPMAEKTT